MEKISWTDRVRNEVLHRVKGAEISLRTIKRREVNWFGHISKRETNWMQQIVIYW